MKLGTAIECLFDNYIYASDKEWIRDKVAWALYQTWQAADNCENCRHWWKSEEVCLLDDYQYEPEIKLQECYLKKSCDHYGDKQVCGRCREYNLYSHTKTEPQHDYKPAESFQWSNYIKDIEAEPKQGEWLFKKITDDYHVIGQCSICKERRRIDNFCPNCGAKMKEQ